MSNAFLGVEQSLCGFRWTARCVDERAAAALAQAHGLSDVLARVLAGRGVGIDDCARFLNPSLRTELPDPSRFRDMDAAANRIAHAIMAGEEVAVFGDYDVDGATSSALLKRFFDAVGGKSRLYIPDRMKEGYGPNAPALLALREAGVSLVITVDCGTLSYAPLQAAAEAGLEVIVCDHHQAQPELPRALAVINPNRLDEAPGYGQLAAVGVAFVLTVAVNRALRAAGHYTARPESNLPEPNLPEPNLMDWLDLVALGTICDVVPLTGLNRALVAQGLKVMAQRRNPGLAALADVARLSEPPGVYHAGFLLGPRVNAGGRVGRANSGAVLLSSDDPAQARDLAIELDVFNAERQAIEAAVLDQATQIASSQQNQPVIVAAAESWHPGVIGIVAGRLKDKFNRPAWVIALDGERGKGSGRSVPGIDMGAITLAAMQAGLLVNGGGHAMAAGLTIESARLEAFTAFALEAFGRAGAAVEAASTLSIDAAVSARGLGLELMEELARAGPFGQGNSEPRLAVARLQVVKSDIVGTNHVRCVFAGADGGRVTGVAFRAAERPLGAALLKGGQFHVAGHARINHWRGRSSVELTIDDAARVNDGRFSA